MHTNFYTKMDLWNNIDAVTSSLREAVVYLSIVGHGANGLSILLHAQKQPVPSLLL